MRVCGVQYVQFCVQSSLLCEGVRVFVCAYYLKGHSLFTGGTAHLFCCCFAVNFS